MVPSLGADSGYLLCFGLYHLGGNAPRGGTLAVRTSTKSVCGGVVRDASLDGSLPRSFLYPRVTLQCRVILRVHIVLRDLGYRHRRYRCRLPR